MKEIDSMWNKLNKDMKEIKLGTWLVICFLFMNVVGIYDLTSYVARIYRLLLKG